MSEEQRCIVIGASHAGANCALNLRRRGWPGAITLLGDEPHMPYHRPPLSKDYLKGAKDRNSILLSNAASYEKANIDLQLNVRVDSIDRAGKHIITSDGAHLEYDKLVLAVGARPRELPLAKPDLTGVCYLRDMRDVDRIRAAARPGSAAVIIGGGYIGLEAAASLQLLGLRVTVLEAMERVLQRVTSVPISQFFTRVHREEGVAIRESVGVRKLVGDGAIQAVELDTGELIAASLVIIGIGVLPNIELAAAAGLTVDNGIVVDEFARSSDPDIYAIGDCASFVHQRYSRPMRLESVQNANDQGLTAAKSIVGDAEPYDSVPWFWSDQYDVKLQIAGLAEGYDEMIVRGDNCSGRSFSVLYLRNSKLLAVDAINTPRDFVHGKKLIQSGDTLNREALADAGVAITDAVVDQV